MDYKKLDLPNTNYPNKEQLKAFETAFNAFLETNQQENENHQNDAFNDLLKSVFKYKVKPTKKIDSAILTRMLVSVSKSHRKGLENYGKDIKT